MADKEIIINGVDVSECCWCDFEPNAEPYCRINDGEDLNCEDNPNCYFKQLKRAEQKLEKIKNYCLKNKVSGWCDIEGIIEIIEGDKNE